MKNSFKKNITQNLRLTSNAAFYKGIIVVLFTSLFMFLTSCKKDYGNVVTKELNLAKFSSIKNIGSSNISIQYGAEQKVEVTTNEDILNRLKNSVSNFELKLDLKDGFYQDYELSYDITIPEIEKVDIEGSGNISVHSFQDFDELKLEINGSGNIVINDLVNLNKLKVDIEGSGNVSTLSQMDSVNILDINIDGSGSFNGFSTMSKDCFVNITGSGNCDVYAKEELDVKIAGSGDVNYKGFPNINSNITGSGNITNKN
ncbi:MAG: head GIN domain-containing protein [Chitinophagales bacterium]